MEARPKRQDRCSGDTQGWGLLKPGISMDLMNFHTLQADSQKRALLEWQVYTAQ